MQNVGVSCGGNGKPKGVKFDFRIFAPEPLGYVVKPFGNVKDIPRSQVQLLVFAADHSPTLCQATEIVTGDGGFAEICKMVIQKAKYIKVKAVAEIYIIQNVTPPDMWRILPLFMEYILL